MNVILNNHNNTNNKFSSVCTYDAPNDTLRKIILQKENKTKVHSYLLLHIKQNLASFYKSKRKDSDQGLTI